MLSLISQSEPVASQQRGLAAEGEVLLYDPRKLDQPLGNLSCSQLQEPINALSWQQERLSRTQSAGFPQGQLVPPSSSSRGPPDPPREAADAEVRRMARGDAILPCPC